MGLFLDNIINTKYTPKYPSDSLVHTYNKKYFDNYNSAAEMLMNKVLLPGEVAFGYYYDENTSYGTNAIFAVGPLSHGSGNILFKNSNDIDNLYNELKDFIKESEDTIDLNLQNAKNEVDNLILNTSTYLINVSNNFNNIVNDASHIITQLNIYNTSINDILVFNDDIENDLQILNSQLNRKIEDTSTYIINLLINSFKLNKPDQELNYLPNVIYDFKEDLYSRINNIDDLSTRIYTNYRDIWKLKNDNEDYKNIINNLQNRIKVLEHMIYHVLDIKVEAQDNIYKLIETLNTSVNTSIFNNLQNQIIDVSIKVDDISTIVDNLINNGD